jgi:hypothetical protein
MCPVFYVPRVLCAQGSICPQIAGTFFTWLIYLFFIHEIVFYVTYIANFHFLFKRSNEKIAKKCRLYSIQHVKIQLDPKFYEAAKKIDLNLTELWFWLSAIFFSQAFHRKTILYMLSMEGFLSCVPSHVLNNQFTRHKETCCFQYRMGSREGGLVYGHCYFRGGLTVPVSKSEVQVQVQFQVSFKREEKQ